MLVDALALLLGERADSGSVRPGRRARPSSRARSRVDATEGDPQRGIDELGLDVEDGRLIVRREVSAEGRSRAWVNGSPTTVARARRSSARCWWTCTASTRPSRCSMPKRSATCSTPSRDAEAERGARGARRTATLARAPRRGGGARREAGRGAPAGRLPAPRGAARSTPRGSSRARTRRSRSRRGGWRRPGRWRELAQRSRTRWWATSEQRARRGGRGGSRARRAGEGGSRDRAPGARCWTRAFANLSELARLAAEYADGGRRKIPSGWRRSSAGGTCSSA